MYHAIIAREGCANTFSSSGQNTFMRHFGPRPRRPEGGWEVSSDWVAQVQYMNRKMSEYLQVFGQPVERVNSKGQNEVRPNDKLSHLALSWCFVTVHK